MKLTKDTIIEGQIVSKGTEVNIIQEGRKLSPEFTSAINSYDTLALTAQSLGAVTSGKPFKESVESIEEISSNYHQKIEDIEMALGYEEAIDAWAKAISVDDGKEFLGYLVNEYEIPIDEIRDRNSLFDAIDEIKEYFYKEEELFNELYYNISDKVARYLVDGIHSDWDL